MNIIPFCFNSSVMNKIIGNKNLMTPDDSFLLVSGNGDSPPDIPFFRTMEYIVSINSPDNKTYVLTAGIPNSLLIRHNNKNLTSSHCFLNWELNVSEFNWDFFVAVNTCHAHIISYINTHMVPSLYITGRPLLEVELASYNWHYGRLAALVPLDGYFAVQTQTWARQGRFEEALSELITQVSPYISLDRLIVQISLLPLFNGINIEEANRCIELVRKIGINNLIVQFSLRDVYIFTSLLVERNKLINNKDS